MKILKRNVSKEEFKDFLNRIDLNDKSLYKELSENQNFVFQFAGNTASRMVKDAKPENFDDVICLNAYSRPGASFGFPTFCDIKNHGGKPIYPEQILQFLTDSHGTICFQEQCMAIGNYITAGKYNGDTCFVGDSLVETEKGKKKIKDLKIGDKVISYNEKTKQKELKEVVNFFNNGIKNTIKLTLENDKQIICTPNHLFLTKNRGWVKAIELKVDDDILDLQSQFNKEKFYELQTKLY